MHLSLSVLEETFAVCRLSPGSSIPEWALKGTFHSVTRTGDELSVVCSENYVGEAEKIDRGWKALKVEGPLDFSLIGIVANLSSILAGGGLSVFVVSTFDTDYILVKADKIERVKELLSKAGHDIKS